MNADCQLTALTPRTRGQSTPDGLHLLKDAPCGFQELEACVGRAGTAVRAIKEESAELMFKIA